MESRESGRGWGQKPQSTILAEKPLGYEIINLGGGKEPVTINQFIQWIEQLTGKKARINHQPVHSADMASTPGWCGFAIRASQTMDSNLRQASIIH